MSRFFTILIIALMFVFLIAACDDDRPIETDPVEQKSGIELSIELAQESYELDEEIIAEVRIENKRDHEQIITVPNMEGQDISFVGAFHQTEGWLGSFKLRSENPFISEAEEPELQWVSVYTLAPQEMLQLEFDWDQHVQDPFTTNDVSLEMLPAPSGNYQIGAGIMLGEMTPREDETMDEMAIRYGEESLEEIQVMLPIEITGERNDLSMKEALDLALSDSRANDWYQDRTYENLVKRQWGKWLLHDRDGQWVEISKEQREHFEEMEPRWYGERAGEQVIMHFSSFYGAAPHGMSVTMDPDRRKVVSVDF